MLAARNHQRPRHVGQIRDGFRMILVWTPVVVSIVSGLLKLHRGSSWLPAPIFEDDSQFQ